MKNSRIMRKGPAQQKGILEVTKWIRQTVGSDASLVEIGCWRGESTEIFAKHISTIYAIDPFLPNLMAHEGLQDEVNSAHHVFMEMLLRNKNVRHIRMTSVEAAERVKSCTFDVVYIDGNHTYSSVKQDIAIWAPLIRSGGIISGHDYEPKKFPGVVKAVNENFTEVKRFGDTSWGVILP